ncbi:MAG: hypothetical protein AAGE99_03865 [Chlamydiota bacterium]
MVCELLSVNERTISQWLEKTVRYVDSQLNVSDLVILVVAVSVFGAILYFLLTKKKRIHAEEVASVCATYERDIQDIKCAHLDELQKAEEKIFSFKRKLQRIEATFEDGLKGREIIYSKRLRKIEKGHLETRSIDEMTIYELKNEISCLRARQINEVEGFESAIEHLKQEIKNSHEAHTKEIERAEMEIGSLRKQLRALIYRV